MGGLKYRLDNGILKSTMGLVLGMG